MSYMSPKIEFFVSGAQKNFMDSLQNICTQWLYCLSKTSPNASFFVAKLFEEKKPVAIVDLSKAKVSRYELSPALVHKQKGSKEEEGIARPNRQISQGVVMHEKLTFFVLDSKRFPHELFPHPSLPSPKVLREKTKCKTDCG